MSIKIPLLVNSFIHYINGLLLIPFMLIKSTNFKFYLGMKNICLRIRLQILEYPRPQNKISWHLFMFLCQGTADNVLFYDLIIHSPIKLDEYIIFKQEH